MKVRCVNNSIRFRLLRSELATLKTGIPLCISLQFPGAQSLIWELVIDYISNFEIDYQQNIVAIKIPHTTALQWIESERVGIETTLHNSAKGLHLLIEKDFPCKDRPDEDKSDTFQELADKKKPDNQCDYRALVFCLSTFLEVQAIFSR